MFGLGTLLNLQASAADDGDTHRQIICEILGLHKQVVYCLYLPGITHVRLSAQHIIDAQ